MSVITKPWNDGNGSITLTFQGQGDGSILVESDENPLGTARSQVITVKTGQGGVVTKNLTVRQAACPFPIGETRNFSYTGLSQSATLPPGKYKIQVWGAQGGSNGEDSVHGITAHPGGKGGYSEGILTISSTTNILVYVGGAGSPTSGGFNGGGSTVGTTSSEYSGTAGIGKMGGGGGATDIRLSSSLYSRMIVAGGGSGAASNYKKDSSGESVTYHDGYAGGGATSDGNASYFATQDAAGYGDSSSGVGFGQGAKQTHNRARWGSGAGGGGWYGGGGGIAADSNFNYLANFMGGGSGFVNTPENASHRPSGYTGLELDSGSTTAGNQSFEAPGGGTETGHEGNGYARITRLA